MEQQPNGFRLREDSVAAVEKVKWFLSLYCFDL